LGVTRQAFDSRFTEVQSMIVTRRGDWMSLHTPAKLNLHLEVLGRRPDGYHDLETLMVPVSVFDTLSFQSVPVTGNSPGSIYVDCQWADGLAGAATGIYPPTPYRDPLQSPVDAILGSLPTGEQNLVTKAIRLVQESAGIRHGAKVCVTKRIPSAAGLGGASSDAAAALKLACAAWNVNASHEQLLDWAAKLGSDVPFFIDLVPAICRGRGELMEPIGKLPSLSTVIVRPPVGLSTPEVFKLCKPSASPQPASNVVDAIRRGDLRRLGKTMRNGLQESAAKRTFWIDRLSEAFAGTNVPAHAMTGSGSCYFGVCRNRREARKVAAMLRSQHIGMVYEAVCISG
jgi:4-diphosphocytidyl-2-C-methyl-D-erythritol kinase